MKVFISWSGDLSHKVAVAFRDWLPSVIQSLDPYVSSEDIDKGARWASDISNELEESTYGILCLTKENVGAPWLNFEAGALSKSVDKSRVSPFLFNLKTSDLQGPLLQFQSTLFKKSDLQKLLRSLNEACGETKIEDGRLDNIFDVWWPKLNEQLAEISTTSKSTNKSDPVEEDLGVSPSSEAIEEILSLVRQQQRLLHAPEEFLPPAYINHVLEQGKDRSRKSNMMLRAPIEDALQSLFMAKAELTALRNAGELIPPDVVEALIDDIERPMAYIHRKIWNGRNPQIRDKNRLRGFKKEE